MAITGRSALVIGSAIGWSLAATVVLTGSLNIWLFTPTPLWQEVLLFPGMVAGVGFYDLSRNWFSDSSTAESIAIWVGVLFVGVAYGASAVVLRSVVIRLRRGLRPE